MNKEDMNFDYKKLHPFKWFILENYPFLEDSIDVLTNYQLFCKLGEMYNKQVNAINILGEQVENLTDWFDDLDVQEEINNKLDAMVEDGTMAEIINQEIFGEINDAINTINNTTIPNIEDQIDTLKRNALYIGNSYVNGTGSTSGTDGIFNLTKNMFNHAYKKTDGGIGWLEYTDHDKTFLTMLSNAVSDSNIPKDEITDIIIVSAWGDTRAVRESGNNFMSTYSNNLQNAVQSFMTTVKANFPNVIRVCEVFAESRGVKTLTEDYTTHFSDAFWFHNRAINIFPKNGIEYLGWIGFNLLLDDNYFSNDHYHPNDAGYTHLASLFKTAYHGNLAYKPINKNFSNIACGIISGSKIAGNVSILPDKTLMNIKTINLAQGSTPAHGAHATLIDFNDVSGFTIPLPTGTTTSSNFQLGTSLDLTTQHPNTDASFSRNNDYLGQLSMQQSSVNANSVMIDILTFGTVKTTSASINSVLQPGFITYSNSYYQ